jgi:HK97 family phage portal protein
MNWLQRIASMLPQRLLNLLLTVRPGEPRIYMPQRQAGVTVNEDTALTFGAVWACVRVISETLAGLPWGVYQRSASGRQAIDNRVQELLNLRPNPEMTAFSFREALIAHALTWGNGYAEIERDAAGRAVALWIVAPDRVLVDRTPDGTLRYRVRAVDGSEQLLGAESVLHLHGLGYDGIVGYSPVRMAARSIGAGVAQDTFAGAFYANGTHVGGTVSVDAKMDPEQIKLVEQYMNEGHRGPDKAFGVKVMGLGFKYEPFKMPLTDAQFLESRKFTVTDIARWFRVPPHKIADLDRSTNNNIEHQSIEFVTDTVVPWALRLEQEVNSKLIIGAARGVQYTKLNTNALMRGDAKSRAEFYRAMTQMGAMSINEVRALEDLNGIGEDGDEHLVQLNQTTLERLVAEPVQMSAPATDPAADPSSGDAPADPESEDTPTNIIRMEALHFVRSHAS